MLGCDVVNFGVKSTACSRQQECFRRSFLHLSVTIWRSPSNSCCPSSSILLLLLDRSPEILQSGRLLRGFSSSPADMKDVDEDFDLYRSTSFHRWVLGRALSSRVLLDSSISSECALLAKYGRLSQSMRTPHEAPPRQRKCGVWRLLAHVLLDRREIDLRRNAVNRPSMSSRELLTTSSSMERIVKRETSTANSTKRKQKKIKRRSSWLPDPERRWPIQGW